MKICSHFCSCYARLPCLSYSNSLLSKVFKQEDSLCPDVYSVRILDVRMYYIREKHHPSCLPTQNVPAVFQFGLNLSRRDQCRVLHRHRGPPSHPTRPPPPARNGSTTPSTPPPTTRPLKRPSTYWRTSGTATPAIRTVTR